MKLFKKIFTLLIFAIIVSCNNQDKQVNSRLDKIESEMKSQIDSLKNQLQEKQSQIDSLSKSEKENSSSLDIPFFIGKTKQEIRDFWSTRVSVEYFHEGIWDDTKQEYFTIMRGDFGVADFAATFKKGLCIEHSTKIFWKDISIIQAKLKKAGYNYENSCKCWTLPNGNHTWTISPNGTEYSLKCLQKKI